MARFVKEIVNQYPSVSLQDFKHPMVFVVDMNNGFLKQGVMHDAELWNV